MKQNWLKKGLIIKPQKNLWWMQTHAMLPTLDHVKDDIFKVYFSGRDKYNISHIGHVVIEVKKKIKVLSFIKEPDLLPGDLGCFDDNGVTPSWIVNYNKKKYLYYIGWNKRSRVRMSLIAGLAISTDGGKTFIRNSKAPLLHRTDAEPLSILTAPCVLRERNKWKMWYVSGIYWKNENLPFYNIKYATSNDGIFWERKGKIAIDFINNNEHALARPCVIYNNGFYRMWYSYKGNNYRIGYADSEDGLKWTRKDRLVRVNLSPVGWDSKMIEYSFIFSFKKKFYMLYNGNDYGREGIGYATLEV